MVKCPFCHAKHVVNTIFCDECGQFLIAGVPTSTEKFPSNAANEKRPTKWKSPEDTLTVDVESDVPAEPPSPSQAPTVCLRIGRKKRKVQFRIDRPVHIGRLDPGKDIFPDIDLTEENTKTKAVSRRHARLFIRDNTIMLEDLDSLNGTFLNGERLPPFLAVNISDGDCIKLGTLKVVVSIVESE